jgi:hypothetical protein
MDSVREKTSALNEPICKEETAEFLIAIDCNQLFPLGILLQNKT